MLYGGPDRVGLRRALMGLYVLCASAGPTAHDEASMRKKHSLTPCSCHIAYYVSCDGSCLQGQCFDTRHGKAMPYECFQQFG
jgi:hypothetical protein